VHVALNYIQLPSHRAALSSFFSGDWVLAKYAQNYFASCLVPSAPLLQLPCGRHVRSRQLCLACWYHRGVLALEDEVHVVNDCPEYLKQRTSLIHSLSSEGLMICGLTPHVNLYIVYLGASWQILATFLAKSRQVHRRSEAKFEALNARFLTSSFAVRRAAWKFKKRPSCRHGVLFSRDFSGNCPCMAPTRHQVWPHARWMPALDGTLKTIVAVKFDASSFRRLGVLQAEARRLGWRS
jgi:hypothetical protein